MFVIAEVVGDLALQGGLQQPLGHLLQQPALACQLQTLDLGPVHQFVINWSSTAFADTASADSTDFDSDTFSLVIDAPSTIGSYTERLTVPSRIERDSGLTQGVSQPIFLDRRTPWVVGVEGRRFQARGGTRKRAPGAGVRHQLVFVDRLVVTLIHLRHDLPHAVLGVFFGVDRSTVTRAVGEVRQLPAEQGFAVPGLCLRTLEDVFAHARAKGVELRLVAIEIQPCTISVDGKSLRVRPVVDLPPFRPGRQPAVDLQYPRSRPRPVRAQAAPLQPRTCASRRRTRPPPCPTCRSTAFGL